MKDIMDWLMKTAEGKSDRDTVYRMYSCTKVVTAAAAMLLLERGKLLLDDPVAHYLPEYGDMKYCRYAGNNMVVMERAETMTVKHLLTMTSGLTYDGIHNTTQQETKKLLEDINEAGGVAPGNLPASVTGTTAFFSRKSLELRAESGCTGSRNRGNKRNELRGIFEAGIFQASGNGAYGFL